MNEYVTATKSYWEREKSEAEAFLDTYFNNADAKATDRDRPEEQPQAELSLKLEIQSTTHKLVNAENALEILERYS